MLIVLQFGSRLGQVVDMTPLEARAMLEDGRATLPEPESPVASPSVVLQQVKGRSDHVPAKVKHRRTR